jgi:hypothetical protein
MLCAALVSFGPRRAAHATESGGGLSIQPVSSNPSAGVTNRPTFAYKLDPGATQHDAVVVSNLNNTAQKVTVYVANAFTTSSGLIGVRANDHAKTGPVDWLKFTTQLANKTFEIPALTSKTIPFEITIPPNAPPGDYAFGVAVAPDASATPQPGQNSVQIVQAAAALVELRVNGPLIPIIRVGSLRVISEAKLTPGFIDGSTAVTFEVVNVGNQRVNTVIHVTERNAFNAVIHREPDIKLSNVLPGSKVKLTRSWDNDPYVKGSITVQITTGTATSATRSVNFWSVSWRTFVVPVALVIVLFIIRWRIRRHRRERDARELAALNPNGPSNNGSHSNGSRGSRKPAPEPAPS